MKKGLKPWGCRQKEQLPIFGSIDMAPVTGDAVIFDHDPF